MRIKSIKETCIYVADLERTRSFYEGKLSLECIGMVKDSHVFLRAGNSMLLCFLREPLRKLSNLPDHNATGSIHFAFEIAENDYEKAKEEIKSKEIIIEKEETWSNNLKSFYFRDPDENLVEIIQEGLWEK